VQMDAFLAQLELAKELNVCAQLHIRDAHGALMDVIRPMHRQGRLPRCILHCYSGSWEMAKEYLDMGMYISVSGVVTFKNAQKLKEVAQNLPADRILVETDCPYMAPVPLRGKRNEPAFVEHTARCVAQLRGADEEQFSLQLCENTKAALGIG